MLHLSIFEIIGYAIIFIACFLLFTGAMTVMCNEIIKLIRK